VTGGRRAVLTVAGATAGFVLVAVAVGGQWGSLERSLASAPLWILAAAAAELLTQVRQLGRLVAARAAPAGPEVDHCRPAPQLPDGDRWRMDHACRQRRCRSPGVIRTSVRLCE
jgi:hypothetical protein